MSVFSLYYWDLSRFPHLPSPLEWTKLSPSQLPVVGLDPPSLLQDHLWILPANQAPTGVSGLLHSATLLLNQHYFGCFVQYARPCDIPPWFRCCLSYQFFSLARKEDVLVSFSSLPCCCCLMSACEFSILDLWWELKFTWMRLLSNLSSSMSLPIEKSPFPPSWKGEDNDHTSNNISFFYILLFASSVNHTYVPRKRHILLWEDKLSCRPWIFFCDALPRA